MPVDWVARTRGAGLSPAPPEPALQLVDAGLRERAGAVLIGPAGVGKTTIARMAAERFGAEFARVDRATATAPAVPFGAFGHLIDVPQTGRTAAVLRAARESLGDGRLLVVDDAHLLDTLSASLVYQLAVSGAASLVVTVGAGCPVPEEISALWRDELLARIDIEPPGHDPSRLATLASEFVSGLSESAHQAVEYLAVEDPLSLAHLSAVIGRDAVEEAEASGAIVVEGDTVRPMHPLFVDAVRDEIGGPELRRVRTELVERLAAADPRTVVDRLRLAVLALDSDQPQPVADVVVAAEEALRLGDLALSERLARTAVSRGGGFAARLTLAYALAWQGLGREADEVLAEVDPSSLTQTELMAWALPRAANQFWMLSEPERATAFLRTTRNRVTSPTARTTLDALSAMFAMNAGNLGRALQTAEQVLASSSADETAVGWAAAAAALTSARMGRFADVDALAERAIAASQPGLLRFTSGFGQTTALLMAGEPARAQELGQRLTDFAQLQQPGRAIGEVLVADVLIARGEPEAAVGLLRGAAAALAPTGYSWGPLALMLLAQALAQLGSTVEAGKALARAESRHGLKSMMFAPELALARAWTLSARKDQHGAVAAARDAARSAERGGQLAVALRALHDAARLGDMRAADAIARVTSEIDCVFGQLALEHARAVVGRDAAALRAVVGRFDEIGMKRSAAQTDS